MRVLVTAASKHGSTAQIAEVIADVVRSGGHDVVVEEPSSVHELRAFDACVIGSAVYAGHWMGAAREFVERVADQLVVRPVWLFSSGPVGEPLTPKDEAVDVDHLARTVDALDHEVFAGRIDRSRLGFGERALVRALKVPEGDYRDWEHVRRWSLGVLTQLDALQASSAAGPGR